MAIYWKLVVTPLQAQGEAREAVVVAENWLSGLRLARKHLGEDGGVPPGASCVMAATGEVTIVDIVSRRRFTLSRTSEAASPVPSAPAGHAPAAPAAAAPAEPAPSPAPAAAAAKVRASTMAYSPEESAAIRANLVAAQATGPSAPAHAPAAPPVVTAPQAHAAAPAAPVPAAAPAPQPAAKRSTVAYSPEESAAVRAQIVAAQPAATPVTASAVATPAVAAAAPPPAQAPAHTPPAPAAATPGKRATVAYLENPFAAAGALVPVSKRDEDPSAASPLLYRERGYFAPTGSDASSAERTLRAELEALRGQLTPGHRGVFISLALFDHYFQGSPTRGPIATLLWKDWRGDPVFSWLGSHPTPTAASAPMPAEGPVRTSFAPETHALPPPPKPAAPAVKVAMRAPSAAMATPAHAARDSWPPVAGTRDATGDQDRRLAVAFEAVQDLYFLSSVAEAMDFSVKLLSELVPCQAVTGCIYDINTDELRFLALTGPGADERRAGAIPSSAGLIGAAAHGTAESLLVPQVSDDPRYDPGADGRIGLESENMLILPLQKAENLLGAVQLINRVQRAGFDAADVAVSAYVASQLAEFLQSKRFSARRPR